MTEAELKVRSYRPTNRMRCGNRLSGLQVVDSRKLYERLNED